ncbi:hypothetical protein ES705_38374 [subsurface metagenome]
MDGGAPPHRLIPGRAPAVGGTLLLAKRVTIQQTNTQSRRSQEGRACLAQVPSSGDAVAGVDSTGRPSSHPALPECFEGGWGSVLPKETDELTFFPVTCGTWACGGCAQRKLARLTAQAHAGKPNKRLMLSTLPDNFRSRIERVRRFRKHLALLVKRIRRAWGPFEYFAPVELTQRAAAHTHILARCGFIDQDWLSRNWEQISGAKVIWIKPIKKEASAVLHAVKYCLKMAAEISQGTPGFRPVTMSAGYLPDDWHPKDAADSDFEFVAFFRLPGPAFYDALERFGFEAVPSTSLQGGLVLRARGPPNWEALDLARCFGSAGARKLAAILLCTVLRPSAHRVPIEQLRDEIDFTGDNRTQF